MGTAVEHYQAFFGFHDQTHFVGKVVRDHLVPGFAEHLHPDADPVQSRGGVGEKPDPFGDFCFFTDIADPVTEVFP